MKLNTIGTDKIVFIIIAGFTGLALLLIVLFSLNEGKSGGGQSLAAYSSSDKEKPKAEVSKPFADLGKMKTKDEKKADFTIKNTGTKPLELTRVNSSCDCTFGKVTIDGKESPEFSMHAKGSWVGIVSPGKEAKVTVIYRPYIMPVSGVVTRDVYIETNDPEKKLLTFSVKAFVE